MHDLVMHMNVIQVYMPTSYLEDRDIKIKNIILAKIFLNKESGSKYYIYGTVQLYIVFQICLDETLKCNMTG